MERPGIRGSRCGGETISALACFNPNPVNRYAERKDHDFYPSELALCRAAVASLDYPSWPTVPTRVLDPGAGAGPWGVAWREQYGSPVTGIEIRHDAKPHPDYSEWLTGSYIPIPTPTLPIQGKNQTTEQFARVMRKYEATFWASMQPVIPERPDYYDLALGNPPYEYSEEFVRRALREVKAGGNVLFLLRAAFTHGQERNRGLFLEHPIKTIRILPERPSFTGDGRTDSTEYSLFLWQKGWRGETTISPLWWRESPAVKVQQAGLFEEVAA